MIGTMITPSGNRKYGFFFNKQTADDIQSNKYKNAARIAAKMYA